MGNVPAIETAGLASVLLIAVGVFVLPVFSDGDQMILIGLFAVSIIAALAWLVLWGRPQNTRGWLLLTALAFGPAYLLGAYIAVVLSFPPGFIHVP